MKKIILLITLLFPILTMGGCSLLIEFIYLQDRLIYDEKLWKHRDTKELVSPELHSSCLYKYRNVHLIKKGLPFGFSAESEEEEILKKGQCLYDQGYIFTGNIFDQFCHHPNSVKDCRLFKRFRR